MFELFMTTTGKPLLFLLLMVLLSPSTITAQENTVPVDTAAPADITTTDKTDELALAQPAEVIVDSGTDAVKNECRRIDDKLGSVSFEDCVNLDLASSSGSTVNNAPILLREFLPLAGKLPQGRVLLLGGVHGDEYSSISIVFRWLQTLDKHHSGLFHWRVIPLVNPDGLLKEGSTRTNANGVDINRNFPTPNWDATALDYWINKTSKNPRNYPGPHAASEPETAWLVEEIEKFDPDVIVSVHAPHGVVDYDGPEDGPYKLGRLYLNLLGTFPGSLGNYAGVQKNIPVVTIELPYAGIMPSPVETSNIWTDLVRWLTGNIPGDKSVAQETDPS
jgi:murein peptide amidase A